MNTSIRIIVADDHHLVRKGIVMLLSSLEGLEVVREGGNGEEILAWLRGGASHQADLALLDLEMPVMDGVETLKAVRDEFPDIPAIILTMSSDVIRLQEAIKQGARGVLFKTASMNEFKDAIEKVCKGGTYFSSEVASLLLTAPQNTSDRLSERETEILQLIAQGMSSNEIGEKLFISPRTVDTHRNNLIQKLEVRGIAGLIRYAIERKLI